MVVRATSWLAVACLLTLAVSCQKHAPPTTTADSEAEQPAAPEQETASTQKESSTAQSEPSTNGHEPSASNGQPPSSEDDNVDAKADAVANGETSAQAEEIIGRVAEFYAQAKSLQVVVDSTIERTDGDMTGTNSGSTTFIAEKPNRISFRYDEKVNQFDLFPRIELISDGDEIVRHVADPEERTYDQLEAPQSMEELLQNRLVIFLQRMGNVGSLMFSLLADDPSKLIMEGVTESTYLGEEDLGEIRAHHLRLERPPFDSDIWIAASGDPVILQRTADVSRLIALITNSPGIKVSIASRFNNWKIDEQLPDDAFALTAPEGADKVADVTAPSSPKRWLGRKAPQVDLQRLDGGDFRLEDHVGKDIVILDFWTTTCVACRIAMPHMIDVATEYKDKGVVFYAVNVAEDPADISNFLEEEMWDVVVPLDTEAQLTGRFRVSGFPTSVVIDKKGIVQSVHEGFAPEVVEILGHELDELLAGNNLVELESDSNSEEKTGAIANTDSKAESEADVRTDSKDETEAGPALVGGNSSPQDNTEDPPANADKPTVTKRPAEAQAEKDGDS